MEPIIVTEKSPDVLAEEFAHGSAEAGLELADRYKEGLGVEQDKNKAIEIYEKIINEKMENDYFIGFAMLNRGLLFNEAESYEQAFSYFNMAAELGNICSYICISLCYEDGLGCEKNSEKSLYWIENAEATDNNYVVSAAHFVHAGWFLKGLNGCEKNIAKALEYYKDSAERDYAYAQETLESIYRAGEIVEKDLEAADYWKKRAEKLNQD